MPADDSIGLSHLPEMPDGRDDGIGVVGAGFIVRDCHLVAYAQAGFPVIGITSRSIAQAREVARLRGVPRCVETVEPLQLSRFLPPENGSGRQSAVLILFGDGPRGPELLLMERAGSLRSHAGQPSFPGGALDPEDGDPQTDGPLRAALREAEEETGLDPAGVQLFGVLPKLYIPVSGFVVTSSTSIQCAVVFNETGTYSVTVVTSGGLSNSVQVSVSGL